MTVDARRPKSAEDLDRLLLAGVKAGVYLVLLMPLIITRETFFPFIVGKALYARSITEVTLGLWLVLAFRNPSYRPPRSWLLFALATYLGMAVLSGFAGVSLQRSLWSTYERMQGVVDLAHWFAFVLVVTSVHRSLRDWRLLLNLNLAVSLAMALLGVAQHLDVDLPFYRFLETGDRLAITLGNATYVGAYMLVNILIALGFLAQSFLESRRSKASPIAERRRRRRRRGRQPEGGYSSVIWWRLFWGLVVVLDLWMITLSGTRGAVIGLSASLVAFAVGYGVWGRLRAVKLAALTLAGVFVGMALILVVARDTSAVERITNTSAMLGRIASTSTNEGSVKDRLASLSFGLEGFAARPVLGWGPENYVVAWGRFYDADADVRYTFDQAHNKLMEELTTKGALGFISYLSLWALMLLILLRIARRQDAHVQIFTWFVGAAFAGYFVQNLFLFDTPAAVLQFFILLGFFVNAEATFEESAAERSKRGPGREGRVSGYLGHLPILAWARSLGGVQMSGRPVLSWLGILGVSALVVLGVYFLNVRPYEASKTIVETSNPSPSITWDQRLGLFEQSIDEFGPLANYPRVAMLKALSDNWRTLTEAEAVVALGIVEREAERLIESEPEWWRAYVDLAHVYVMAAALDPDHLIQAREYFDEAVELAPETRKVAALRARLEEAERIYAVAGSAERVQEER